MNTFCIGCSDHLSLLHTQYTTVTDTISWLLFLLRYSWRL